MPDPRHGTRRAGGAAVPRLAPEAKETRIRDLGFPSVSENYRGFDIWYDPVRGQYYASHCEHTRRSESIEVIREWLDREKL